jgi:hypothetical protein
VIINFNSHEKLIQQKGMLLKDDAQAVIARVLKRYIEKAQR